MLNGLNRLRETWLRKYVVLTDDLNTVSRGRYEFFKETYQRHVIFDLSHLKALSQLLIDGLFVSPHNILLIIIIIIIIKCIYI